MSSGDFVGIVLILAGYVPLWFAMKTSRRWLRVVLSLAAFAYLSLLFAASLFVSDGERAHHGGGYGWFHATLACVFAISALAAFVLVFIPTRRPIKAD